MNQKVKHALFHVPREVPGRDVQRLVHLILSIGARASGGPEKSPCIVYTVKKVEKVEKEKKHNTAKAKDVLHLPDAFREFQRLREALVSRGPVGPGPHDPLAIHRMINDKFC